MFHSLEKKIQKQDYQSLVYWYTHVLSIITRVIFNIPTEVWFSLHFISALNYGGMYWCDCLNVEYFASWVSDNQTWLEINSWIDTCWLIRALICNLMKTISLPYPEELYSSWFPFTILSSFVILVFYYTYSYLKFPPTSPKINLVSIHKNKYCSYITVNGQYFIATLYEIKKKIT